MAAPSRSVQDGVAIVVIVAVCAVIYAESSVVVTGEPIDRMESRRDLPYENSVLRIVMRNVVLKCPQPFLVNSLLRPLEARRQRDSLHSDGDGVANHIALSSTKGEASDVGSVIIRDRSYLGHEGMIDHRVVSAITEYRRGRRAVPPEAKVDHVVGDHIFECDSVRGMGHVAMCPDVLDDRALDDGSPSSILGHVEVQAVAALDRLIECTMSITSAVEFPRTHVANGRILDCLGLGGTDEDVGSS